MTSVDFDNEDKDAFLSALTKETIKKGYHGNVPKEPTLSAAGELTLKRKLRIMIMMRENMEQIEPIVKELHKLGSDLRLEEDLADAHGNRALVKLLEKMRVPSPDDEAAPKRKHNRNRN